MNETQEVAAYYDRKSEGIFRRYGPGPRVHFHTGIVEASVQVSEKPIREQIFASQEALLQRLAKPLVKSPNKVLEVGCGLGGGALFWAMEHGAHVTALTTASSQVRWVERLAKEAGVADRVWPLLQDANTFETDERFDAIVTVESLCYLPRCAWFSKAKGLLNTGGHVLVADCCLGQERLREPFDRHWKTQIDTADGYKQAAKEAGLELVMDEDLSWATAPFWELTARLIETEEANSDAERAAKWRSLEEHARLGRALSDGGLRYALLAFKSP